MPSKEYAVVTCWAVALSKHCMSRRGNSHVTGQAVRRVGGSLVQKVHRMSENTSSRRRRWCWCWWEAESAFFLFYPTTFVLKILRHQVRIQYIYIQHYNANTDIVQVSQNRIQIYNTASKRELPEDVGLAPETRLQSRLIR